MPDRDRFLYSRKHFLNWFVLAFIAGSVNVGGFLACHRFVSHVTGFATQFGADFAYARWEQAFGMLTAPGFFLAGAMLAAWLIERRLHHDLRPRYGVAMSIVAGCFYLAAFGGWRGWFGRFGAPLNIRSDYFLLALLCTASGIQNAVVTSVSGAIVRTTHLTGITTDLGIGLVRILFPAADEGKLKRERQFTKLRLGTITAFILGATAGAILHERYGYLAFLLPAFLASASLVASLYIWQKPGFSGG